LPAADGAAFDRSHAHEDSSAGADVRVIASPKARDHVLRDVRPEGTREDLD